MTTETREKALAALFEGKKSKWLPLYRRLLARFTNVPGIEFFPFKGMIAIGHKDDLRPTMGAIRVTIRGLDIGLGLSKSQMPSERLRVSHRSPKWITHHVVVAGANEIDEEFLSWVKAARHQARIARPRSA